MAVSGPSGPIHTPFIRPWKIVPTDQSIFSVTIDKLKVRDAAMSAIGQMGHSLALLAA